MIAHARRQRHSEFSYHSYLRMGSPRLPARRPRRAAGSPRRRCRCLRRRGRAVVRDVLLPLLAGSAFIVATALKLVVAVWRRLADVPASFRCSAAPRRSRWSSPSAICLWRLFVLVQRQLLWRVRRKLILSYIFIGVVPALLIIVFCLIRRAACCR